MNQNKFNYIITKFWNINYGKYQILNEIKILATKYDEIFYSDHDIEFLFSDKYFFHKLHSVIREFIEGFHIGLIALNQMEDCRHQPNIYQNKININGIDIIYPKIGTFGSIAGGCFFLDSKAFQKINDFELNVVYGFDDYYLQKNLFKKEYISIVIMDLYVKHPFIKNKQYTVWKKNCIENQIKKKKTNYFMEIQKSHNFWSSMQD